MFRFFLIILMSPLALFAADPIAWDQVEALHEEKEVLLRGFTINSPAKGWVLRERPSLPSCCTGLVPCKKEIVLINPPELSSGKAVTLRGTLFTNSKDHALFMKNIEVQRVSGLTPKQFIWIFSTSLFLSLLGWKFKKRKRVR